MEQQVAETIARSTRDEAEQQARNDLEQLRRQAVEAGRERSRKIIKITVINTATGEISYNPAGRLLRDWYLHVYINSVRASLSRASETIDTRELDEAATVVGRVRPELEPVQAQQAIAATRSIAVADAAAVAARITERLHAAAAGRAISHAPDQRFEGDQLRVHVIRHWYQRCYDSTIDEAVRARHPLAAVTDAETVQVASILATGEPRRVIGDDGIPLAAGRTMVSKVDQSIAAERADATPAFSASPPRDDQSILIAERLRQAWLDMDHQMRAKWLRAAGDPGSANGGWPSLQETQQAMVIQHYREMHRRDLLDTDPPRIERSPAETARTIFNHPASLATSQSAANRELGLAQNDPEGRYLGADTRSTGGRQPDDLRPASRRVQ